jgi:hypothetical protein
MQDFARFPLAYSSLLISFLHLIRQQFSQVAVPSIATAMPHDSKAHLRSCGSRFASARLRTVMAFLLFFAAATAYFIPTLAAQTSYYNGVQSALGSWTQAPAGVAVDRNGNLFVSFTSLLQNSQQWHLFGMNCCFHLAWRARGRLFATSGMQ